MDAPAHPDFGLNRTSGGGWAVARKGGFVPWQQRKTLVVDFSSEDGLIGWTGYESRGGGRSQMTSCGVGISSFALSVIASWLADEPMPASEDGDGHTACSPKL